MTTFLYSELDSLNKRFNEIDTILTEASKYIDDESKNDVYNTLCRSAQVLLIAHFEGYLKDIAKNILDDINHFSSFKDSKQDLKYSFCEYFFLNDNNDLEKAKHKKRNELVTILDETNVKFTIDKFLPPDNNNKNPRDTLIRIGKKFGINEILDLSNKSKKLTSVFSNSSEDTKILKEELKNHITEATLNYPYTVDTSILNIKEDISSSHDNFWEVFFHDILQRRNNIVHGKETNNSVSHHTIEADKIKIQVLIYTFMILICEKANPAI